MKLPVPNSDNNQKGVVPLLLIAIAGVLVLLTVFSLGVFKTGVFKSLFPKQFSQAAGIVDLSLVPTNVSTSPNGTFNLDVSIDTKTASVSAAIVDISWDPAILQVQSFTPGTFLKGKFPLDPNPFFDNTLGRAIVYLNVGVVCSNPFDQSTCLPNPPVVGTGTLATLQFRALQSSASPSEVRFNPTVYSGSDYASGTIVTATYISSTNVSNPGDVTGILTPSNVSVSTSTVNRTANFSLSPATVSSAGGVEFPVQVRAQSDTDEANLYAAKLRFDPTKLQVTRIDTAGSFVTQWADQSFDNTGGKVSLVGGIPAPGFKTSGTSALEATVYFRGLIASTSNIDFDGTSAVYRNSDNADILNTTTSSAVTITTTPSPSPSPSASASPSPSAAASPSPSAAASPSPSPSPSASASPSPSAAASPSPSAAVSPSPSPSPSPLACSITSGNWNLASNPVDEGTLVSLTVNGSGNCQGQKVSIQVREDDGLLGFGSDPVRVNPVDATFNGQNTATTSWVAEYQQDGLNGANDPPEYFFIAGLISNGTTVNSSGTQLQVNKLAAGTFKKGDGNRDGIVNLQDLSILLSNWNKNKNTDTFPAEININDDDVINTFDFSGLVLILRAAGVL